MNNHQLSLAKKKTVLITGASAGIGHALSVLFAKNQYDLVLVARNTGRLEKIAEELEKDYGISATYIAADLSDLNAPEKIYEELQSRNIRVNILVNNAGFNVYGKFSETDLQKEIDLIHVNLGALTILTKLLLPDMLKNNNGKILNIGSTGSFAPGPYNAVYCATKAYVLSFSQAISEELKGTGVSVTTLCPGATRTEFAKRAGMTDVRLFGIKGMVMDAERVAQIGYNALMANRAKVVTGWMNKFQIFMIRFTPPSLLAKSVRYFMDRKYDSRAKSDIASALKILAFFSLLSLIAFNRGVHAAENWRLKLNKNDIKVYTRVEEKGAINEVRTTGIIEAGIRDVASYIEDISSYPRWMANCIEANLHKQIDKNQRIVYSVNKLQWPFYNREAYYLQNWHYDNSGKRITMTFTAIASDMPVPDGNVRMSDVTGKWTFKKISPHQTAVDFRMKCDPSGNLPVAVVNMVSASMPYDSFSNLEKECRKPR